MRKISSRKKTMFLSLLLAFVFTVAVQAKPTKSVERGMTKEQVTNILGKPQTTNFNDSSETWQYVKSRGGLLDSYTVNITVGFDTNGTVVRYDEAIVGSSSASDSYTPSSSSSAGDQLGLILGSRHPQCSLSDSDYDVLLSKVRQASFESGRLDLIQVASLGGYFTCRQCANLLSVFTFVDGKIKALRFMAPHIVDAQNASDIYRQFTFSSDKDKAAEIMRGARNGR